VKNFFLLLTLILASLVCALLFYRDQASAFSKEQMSEHDRGKPCIYYYRIPDDDNSPLPDHGCLFESQETAYELSPEINVLISEIIKRDFPDYSRTKAWALSEYQGVVGNFAPIQWVPLVNAVWICDDPEVQPLTTESSALALCSVKPSLQGFGYDAALSIYEIKKKKSGMVDVPMYHEVAVASRQEESSFLIGGGFSVFGGRLVAVVHRHSLKAKRLIKTQTKILVHSDRIFKPFFEFDSFFYPVASQACDGSDRIECQATTIRLDMEPEPLTTGSTVFLDAYIGLDAFNTQPQKKIPFIFDAESWTLKRKFPRKPDESF